MLEKPIEIKDQKARINKSEARAQAALMMVERLKGNGSVKRLAEHFGVAPRTVNNRLALARQDGVPDQAREIFIDSLLPESMAVLQEALQGEDLKLAVQVASKIVDGLKILEGPKEDSPATVAGATETLELFRARLTRKKTEENESASPIIDAESIPDPIGVYRAVHQRALPVEADLETGVEASGTERTAPVCVPSEPWDGSDVAPTPASYQAYSSDSSDASGVSVARDEDAPVDHEE